jgi:hypothetical protein
MRKKMSLNAHTAKNQSDLLAVGLIHGPAKMIGVNMKTMKELIIVHCVEEGDINK